jgi:esterase/lipase superfamily enzyme
MRRDYHKWYSPSLGRDMEMLIFGDGGLPALVFPTSCGRFFEFEEFGMCSAIGDKLERGEVQLFCVDSVDAESWYNRDVPPRWKIARQLQYEAYCMHEVMPLLRQMNWSPSRIALGCSFGGYHAANLSLRHPDDFTGFLSMGGAFDTTRFLHGFHDEDVYFNEPLQYIPNVHDYFQLEKMRRSTYVLATGEWDICRGFNEDMARVFAAKGIPCRHDVWGDHSMHDWPYWKQMLQTYL